MLHLEQIDLSQDSAAGRFIKTEVVQVMFAKTPGELVSLEGPNKYQTGDALITGCTGDRWSVDRHRFDAKYQPVSPTLDGQDGAYTAKPVPVLAKQINEPYAVTQGIGRCSTDPAIMACVARAVSNASTNRSSNALTLRASLQ